MEITGKTVVVTGGASGIGRAIADACAMEGARLVLADIEQGALDQARAALVERGVEVAVVRTDVRQAEDLVRLRDVVDRTFGGADVVCNNAGVLPPMAPVWQTPLADLEWVLAVNLWGIVHGVRAFVPGMVERGRPAYVVNTASMAAFGPSPYCAGYAMSKAAVVSLSSTLREELEAVEAPVGVSVLLPEMIRTRLASSERNRGDDSRLPDQDPPVDVFEGGLDPAVIGARVTAAIRAERFWVLPPPEDQFMAAARAWMEEIRDALV